MKHKSNEGFILDGIWKCWICYGEFPREGKVGDRVRVNKTGNEFTIGHIMPSSCYPSRIIYISRQGFKLFYDNEVELL